MTTGDPDPRMVALSKAQERHAQHLRRHDQILRVLSQQVAELVEMVQDQEAESPAVRSWLLADDPHQAGEDLTELVEWLDSVYLRYPGAELPTCWAWHPAIVEELWWLRCAHHDAYHGPGASYARVADWHDRQRPGVVQRLVRWQRGCDLPQHQQAPPALPAPLPGSAARIASTWATCRSTPEPTAEELAHATVYEDDRNHRKSR